MDPISRGQRSHLRGRIEGWLGTAPETESLEEGKTRGEDRNSGEGGTYWVWEPFKRRRALGREMLGSGLTESDLCPPEADELTREKTCGLRLPS